MPMGVLKSNPILLSLFFYFCKYKRLSYTIIDNTIQLYWCCSSYGFYDDITRFQFAIFTNFQYSSKPVLLVIRYINSGLCFFVHNIFYNVLFVFLIYLVIKNFFHTIKISKKKNILNIIKIK